ncbi:hypothetical protein GCM10017744_064360 [Streptomyces antimycoticus]
MTPLPRRHFLAGTAVAGGLLAVGAPGAASAASRVDKPFLALLTEAADARVAEVVDGLDAVLDQLNNLGQARPAARGLRLLTSVHVWGDAAHHHDGALIAPMTRLVDALAAAQFDDGLYDQGAVHSPPDTAFSIVDLGLVYGLLDADGHTGTRAIRATLKTILLKAGKGLSTGGVHTPNHRWKVCAALARINSFWPDARFTRRIDAWLAEGIDQYDSGQYSERSATYAPIVTNPSLLTLARLTERPRLYDHVRRNLEATLHLLEPNGEVETVHSRRQDQKTLKHLSEYWLQFRALALRERDGRFAAVAATIQRRGADQTFDETPLGDFLAEVLDHPELAAPLPKTTGAPGSSPSTTGTAGWCGSRRGTPGPPSSAAPTSLTSTRFPRACPPTRRSSNGARARPSWTRSGCPRSSSRSATSGPRTWSARRTAGGCGPRCGPDTICRCRPSTAAPTGGIR